MKIFQIAIIFINVINIKSFINLFNVKGNNNHLLSNIKLNTSFYKKTNNLFFQNNDKSY
jgi:hypothetical protein